jgi:altronate hydrolase
LNTIPEGLPLSQVAIKLNTKDNIVIAKLDLKPGQRLSLVDSDHILLREPIPAGHKIAISNFAIGDPVIRYGQVIGRASLEIRTGQHVHTHNVQPNMEDREYVFSVDMEPIQVIPEGERRQFMGFIRGDGRVGTRNFIAVIASVQCAAQVSRLIASHFTPERLKKFPNVDGVFALTPDGGCAGSDYTILRRTLTGMANHPNVAGSILVGLGCEGNQLEGILESPGMVALEMYNQPPLLEIQALGGSQKTIQAGIQAIEDILPRANAIKRTSQPLSKLTLALECGGSDSWSGITANPLVGLLSDSIINQGGTVVLAETPEIFGAEHLLTRRAICKEVGEQLLAKLDWWKDYTHRMGSSFEDNPTPGNLAGGLTNICEKSLGAIAKSGSTPLTAVYEFAEQISCSGFVFMDTPGYDPVSVTGMVAGGCNMVLFTTGRGSVFGFKPSPSIKICTNETTFQRMSGDMDINAGRVLEGNTSLATLAAEMLDLVIAVASGQLTKSDKLGLGEIEFLTWNQIGPM